jgi:hypothetical protein
VLRDALEAVTAGLAEALGPAVQVADHAGRFTARELGQVVLARQAVRVAIEGIPSAEVDGTGLRKANVRFIAFVICADTPTEYRHHAALRLVEVIAGALPYQTWGRPERFRPVAPGEIAMDNLLTDEHDGKGVAWWGVSWTQAVKAA